MHGNGKDRSTVVDQLNSFLRGEISAAETYRRALEKVQDATVRSVLSEAQHCHATRADKLRDKIRELGGEPASGSGPWGTFVKLLEDAAMPLGDGAIVTVLTAGEDHGLRDYVTDQQNLDAPTRQWLHNQLMEAQERTSERVGQLKRAITGHAQG